MDGPLQEKGVSLCAQLALLYPNPLAFDKVEDVSCIGWRVIKATSLTSAYTPNIYAVYGPILGARVATLIWLVFCRGTGFPSANMRRISLLCCTVVVASLRLRCLIYSPVVLTRHPTAVRASTVVSSSTVERPRTRIYLAPVIRERYFRVVELRSNLVAIVASRGGAIYIHCAVVADWDDHHRQTFPLYCSCSAKRSVGHPGPLKRSLSEIVVRYKKKNTL